MNTHEYNAVKRLGLSDGSQCGVNTCRGFRITLRDKRNRIRTLQRRRHIRPVMTYKLRSYSAWTEMALNECSMVSNERSRQHTLQHQIDGYQD